MPDQKKNHGRPPAKSGSRAAHEWTLSDAKAHLSQVVQQALDGEVQRIVRGGRESVVMVSEERYRAATQPRRSLVDLFSALRGVDIDLSRENDTGREIDL